MYRKKPAEGRNIGQIPYPPPPPPPLPTPLPNQILILFTTYPSIVIRINKVDWCFSQGYYKWIIQTSLFFFDFIVHLAHVRYSFQHLTTILKIKRELPTFTNNKIHLETDFHQSRITDMVIILFTRFIIHSTKYLVSDWSMTNA